ncbi:hypothetical protein [Candidatus Nanosyncoccus alces]|uniref:Uncharacterized protein n=1 Tax=Candidatus Nanosyncoccus alces TaxID=2171997 RepID=A0ABY0FLU9_9BACT|nr:hypothetical protein [Candidatus Nanosyncoccus alces]RYC74819.1 hypothetical protein G3RUM_00368 [Candidatus Nanosyncoccus alces]
MNKALSIIITFAMIVLLVGCSKTNSDTTSEHTEAKGSSVQQATERITEAPTEAPTEVQPIVESRHSIKEIITPFSEDRAWVTYVDNDNELNYGVIDTNGYLVYNIKQSEVGDGWYSITASEFKDGVSCLHVDNSSRFSKAKPGMIIVNNKGNVVFDSRETDDTINYFYWGYGDETILIVKQVADFSSNTGYICEMNTSGEIEKETKLEEKYVFDDDYQSKWLTGSFRYYGEGIFLGGYLDMIYNKNNQELFQTYEETGATSKGIPFLRFYDVFEDSKTIGSTTTSDRWDDSVSEIRSIAPSDLTNYEKWMSYCDNQKIIWGPNIKINYLSEGLINNTEDNEYYKIKKGIYDYDGRLIAEYPSEWNIEQGDGFSNGLAALKIKGADKKYYVTVVNKNGKEQYKPIKVDECTFPAWHGYIQAKIDNEDVIISPAGEKTSLNEINQLSEDYAIGEITVHNGFRKIKNAKTDKFDSFSGIDGSTINTVIILSNYEEVSKSGIKPNATATETSETIATKIYQTINEFSIVGKWKNVGEYTFGQAQKGSIISFDGTNCNFFSPKDTYAFYKNGDNYKLDCTSPLADTVSFTVKIIDENNIDIFNGSDIVELTRVS